MTTTAALRPIENTADAPYCARMDCGETATLVHTVRWNTGNTKGVSFFPVCPRHAGTDCYQCDRPGVVTKATVRPNSWPVTRKLKMPFYSCCAEHRGAIYQEG